MKLRLFLLLVTLVAIAYPAAAEGALFQRDLADRIAELRAARGPEAYAALRRVWASWDRANPTHVEETLLAAREDSRLSPPLRTYAGVLAGLSRVRRGDLRAARDAVSALGYVDRWVVIGPFDNEGKSGLDTAFGPELELASPIVPGRAQSGKERPVRWRVVPREFPHGFVNFGSLLRPEQKVCAYATTFVQAKPGSRAPRTISAWIGSGGAFKAYWNGHEVLKSTVYSSHDFDRYAVALELESGMNALTVKICGEEAAPVLSVRFGDAQGAPNAGVDVTNDL
ncbi:MAG TPA: hypothetical protein VGK73_01835, partial [Polyangiaceae bacterium]